MRNKYFGKLVIYSYYYFKNIYQLFLKDNFLYTIQKRGRVVLTVVVGKSISHKQLSINHVKIVILYSPVLAFIV